MNILLQTRFPPSVGGIETLSLVLCREWQALGYQVSVSTDVAEPHVLPADIPYPVYHRASGKHLVNLWKKHDVVVMMNLSLKAAWPMLLCSTPVVFTHHSCYWVDLQEKRDWRERLKLRIARLSQSNICVSTFVQQSTGLENSKVVANCYDDSTFNDLGTVKRDRDFVFVGRLVSDKGVDLLLQAFSKLPTCRDLKLTIIGDGPERSRLEDLVRDLGIDRSVLFTGSLSPLEVAAELRRHKIMVVPSLVKEAFGIVALEGMACGCAMLVADGGGLPEAVGIAGRTFKQGNIASLVENLSALLGSPLLRAQLAEHAVTHLIRHGSKQMADAYLEVIHRAIEQNHSKPNA